MGNRPHLKSAHPAPSVFVVHDDPKMLRLIAEALDGKEFHLAPHASATDFLDAFQPNHHGCLLLDGELPDLGALELQRELLVRQIDLPIIFLTANADVSATVEIMKQGAADVLQKPIDPDMLLAAVRQAVARDAAAWRDRQRRFEISKRLESLTPREREVMELVVTGHANKQIARQLKLSERTVEIHRGHVMKKMQAASVADLVRQSVMAAGGTLFNPHLRPSLYSSD